MATSNSPRLNHHGWVLFTDGAWTAASTTKREISAGELASLGSSPDGAPNTFMAHSSQSARAVGPDLATRSPAGRRGQRVQQTARWLCRSRYEGPERLGPSSCALT